MLRSIIAIVALFVFTKNVHSQSFENQLLALEYQVFRADNDTVIATLILQKVDLYIDSNRVVPALLNDIKRLDYTELDSTQQARFLWNSSLTAYLLDDAYFAVYYLKKLDNLPSTKNTNQHRLMSALIYSKYDQVKFQAILDSVPEFAPLNCIIETSEFSIASKNWIKASSAVVPGLGMMINGRFLKGFTALLLTAGSITGLRWMALNNLPINFFGWGINGALKLYLGNIRLTGKLTEEREAKLRSQTANNCGEELFSLLKKYPLTFR